MLELMESVVSAQGTGRRAALRGVRVAGKTGTAQKFDSELGRYSQTRYVASFMGVAPADDPKLVIVTALDEPQGEAHGGGDVAAPLFARTAADQLARLGIATAPQAIRAQKYHPMMAEPAPDTTQVTAASAPLPAPPPRAKPKASSSRKAPALQRDRVASSRAKHAAARPYSLVARAAWDIDRSDDLSKRANSRDTDRRARSRSAASVLVPEFRGTTIAEAKRLAAEYTVEVELHGSGLAVAQDPAPGTVLTGSRPRVRVRFSAAVGEG
jgi:membrane peptidoglycan carboxypeptidase